MITEQQIRDLLAKVFVPVVEQSVTDLNLVRNIAILETKITITLASTALTADVQKFVAAGVKTALQPLKGAEIAVEFVEAKPQELNAVKLP